MDKLQLQLELDQVNLAITEILSGKRLSRLRIGDSSFTRDYTFNPQPLEELTNHRKDLLAAIHALDVEFTPNYNQHSHVRNLVVKRIEY